MKWLQAHPLISISALCTMVDYDKPNLDGVISGARPIPAKFLDKFEQVLGRYGFMPGKDYENT